MAAGPPIVSLAVATESAPAQLLAGSQTGVTLQAIDSFEPQATFASEMGVVHDLAFSPDHRWLAVAGGRPSETGELRVYGWPSRSLIASMLASDDVFYSVSWHPDSKRLAVASHDTSVRIVDLVATGLAASRGEQKIALRARRLEGHSRPVRAVEWVNDQILVSAGADRSLRVWQPLRDRPLRILNQHTGAVVDLRAQPSGAAGKLPGLASAGADRTVRIWQPTIGRLVRFARLEAVPNAICWTADGRHVAAACQDGAVYVIDSSTAAVVQRQVALRDGWPYAIVSLESGRLVVGGSGQKLRIVTGLP